MDSLHHSGSGLHELATRVASLRDKGKVIVQCHGVFDLLHPGHLNHLEEAKAQGDILVVTVTPDHLVNKGPGRPVFTQDQRVRMLRALDVVDFVAVTASASAVESISLIRPDVYAKGPDYADPKTDLTGNISVEQVAVEEVGGRLHITLTETMSSSTIINTHLSQHDESAQEWLKGFRTRHSEESVLGWLHDVSTLKVLVVGEAIIDEYVLCEALGKSSKDPVLAFRELSRERHVGGSLAIGRHCAGLGAQVSALFRIGSDVADAEFIKDSLGELVTPHMVMSSSEPTIVKRRFVDSLTETRVFETYVMDDGSPEGVDEQNVLAKLGALIPDADLVIVADYGHGLLSPGIIAALAEGSKMLAVNTQSNAGNRGFNTISRYPRVDFVCLNGSEVGLELRRRHMTVNELVPQIRERTGARRAIVTEGAKGLACCDEDGVTTHVPAFAQMVRDRVGAGDALFAATALLSAVEAPADITGFFGNLAGAASVADLGNRNHIESVNLMRHASVLMK